MKTLTKAEEQIMQYLWKIEKGFMKDIINEFPEPKPAYTTIATVITVLVKKEFVKYNQYGKVREYYPTIKKNKYYASHIKGIIKNNFSNSVSQFASFFTNETNLSLSELEELKKIVTEKIKKEKK